MKRLLSITLALLLAVCLSAGVASVLAAGGNEITVTDWGNTGFERVDIENQGFMGDPAYVISISDSTVWAAICPSSLGTGNILPNLSDWSFIVSIDETDYTCERVSIFNQGSAGFVRFVLPESFSLAIQQYSVSWRITNGSVTYVSGEPIIVNSTITNAPGEALSGEAVDAVMSEKTLVNDKIENYSLDDASAGATFGDGPLSNLFDGKYTEADGTKFGTGSNHVVITWQYTDPVKLTHYVLVTGGDSASYSSRNPYHIVLKGSQDGSAWTEIDNVANAGIEAANHTPFGFVVDHPDFYTYYQITLDTSSQCQLDELLTYGESQAPVTPPVTEPEPEVTTTPEPEVTEPEQTEAAPGGTTAAPGTTATPGTTAAPGTTSTPGTSAPDTTGGGSSSTEKDDSPVGWIIAVVVIVVVAVAAVVVIVVLKKKKK